MEADVVEQRGELEQLAVGVGQPVQRAQAAEEIERQPGDVLGVRLVGVAAARQAHHRAAAQIGVLVDELDARPVARRVVGDQPLAQRRLAQDVGVGVHHLEERADQDDAGDDRVDALGIEVGQARALGGA